MNKYVLVTGSSGGVGKATCFKLLNQGYKVIGVDINKPEIEDKNFYFFKANLILKEDIDNLFNEVNKITKHLDILLHLSGIFIMQTLIEGSEEDLRKIIEINFFGVYRLNRALFPLLDKTSRIIIFSSEVSRYSPQPFNGYYALSKITLDKYADILRREFNYIGIKVIKVQTGAIKTKLFDGVNDKFYKMANASKYYLNPLTKLKFLMDKEINKQLPPEKVANKLSKIINSKHPKICYRYHNSGRLSFLNILPERLQDYIYKVIFK